MIGTLISARCATLHELQTVYGVQDAYDLMEVHNVDMFNELKVKEFLNKPAKR